VPGTCLCGAGSETWARVRWPWFGQRRLYRCRTCHVVTLQPFPTTAETNAIYQSADYLSKIPPTEYRGYYGVFEEHLRSTLRLPRSSAILDFGAGYCFYQRFFLDDGYQATHSVEINQQMLGFARQKLGLTEVYASTDALPRSQYDVVLASQVVEHLERPLEVLHDVIAPLLRPGGILCFGVPNWDAFSRLVLGPRWPGYSPEDHLWFFNGDSARRLFGHARDPHYELIDLRVRASAGKPYDGYRPTSFAKRFYYRTLSTLFERIGRGDQLLVTLRRR
jgi:SAM-dependent methyltransferase